MTTPLGDRMRRVNSMLPRERRRWVGQLMTAQEALDKAGDALDEVMLKAYDAGLSYASIGGALGLHPTTVQDRVRTMRENS